MYPFIILFLQINEVFMVPKSMQKDIKFSNLVP